MELRTSLQQALGVQLSGTLVFDYPTAAAVAAHCHQLLSAAAAATACAADGTAAAAAPALSLQDAAAAVAAAVAAVSGAVDLAPDTPLLAAGLDSLSAVELGNELQRALGLRLPGTLVFDYPTPASLAAFLHRQSVAAASAGGPATVPALAAPPSCAVTLASRQQLVVTLDSSAARLSTDCISSTADRCRPTPYARWDADGAAAHGIPHRPGSRFGGFLDGVEGFDAGAFGIAPSEALLIDPQQRLMLEVGGGCGA